jgi:hypothetical protein
VSLGIMHSLLSGTLQKNQKIKIGTFTDFLDLHLADSIARVLPKIETTILAMLSNETLILVSSLNHILDFGDGSGVDFSDSLLLMLIESLILAMLSIESSILVMHLIETLIVVRTLYHFLLLALYHSLMLSITILLSIKQEFSFGNKILISAMTSWNVEFAIFKKC